MHNFEISVGETTVMYCKICGESYTLVQYAGDGRLVVWVKTPFKDQSQQNIDPPGKCNAMAEFHQHVDN